MNSDSSASTTPMVLTPDSTGTGSSPDSIAAAKKTRRQTAFYPNVNSSNKPQKPFSRSAAKRESVMALGSIEHLQHYFTKTGIAAKKNPLNKPHHGLVPAIGGLTHIRTSPSIGSHFELPPSPAIPPPQLVAFPPHVKAYDIDPDSLLPGVVNDLAAVAQAWQIDTATQPPADPRASLGVTSTHTSSGSFDVLGVLKITTRTVRSIRNYLLSLPDESAGTIRAHFRPKLLGPGKSQTATAPSSSTVPDPLTLIRKSALEVLTVLRELEERYRLPLSDDAYDAQSDGGGSRGGGPHSRVASPSGNSEEPPTDEVELEMPGYPLEADSSITFSVMQVQGRLQTVPVWEDEEDEFEQEEEKEKREHWDERLVIGSGWLYRQDVKLSELEKERKVVSAYLDVVDEVLFEWKRDEQIKERGWERERRKAMEKGDRGVSRAKARRVSAIDGAGPRGMGMLLTTGESGRRRVSTGMLDSMSSMTLSEEPESIEDINEDDEAEASVDDEELPLWAQRSSFVDDDLGRAYAFLSAFLPAHLLSALDPPTSRRDFLASLSSGQLLCVAYNACVRKSKHPWGYVSRDGIHDILALEKAERDAGKDDKAPEGGKKGWTFRRTDNLRLWAGALKLRYMLPIYVPSQSLAQASGIGTPANAGTPLGSPIRATHRTAEPPVVFDAKVVAKKDDGWEDMLETVLLKWVRKTVEEKRNAH
ncbi:hypothetical protein D9615_008689 [Tricholomella constricta]|uniref:Uncharacterized protein n=1 Tax=Tricholomella constricta TaxID=117010 RepID=A0A8H5H4P6_9AGAR|nr:hypothetical protein D9615_008689 [Tricholomella constricta]